MTEHRIFQILLKNNKNGNYNYDFPKLQADAVDIAAEKFTEIISETLKQKSTASQLKRLNILRYIHTTCGVKQCHVNEDSYECFLRILRKSLQSNASDDLSKFIAEINSELDRDVPMRLVDKMVDFYKKKNAKQKEKVEKLDFIHEKNEEKLKMKFDMQAGKTFSYHETSEEMIRDLIGNPDIQLVENQSTMNKIETVVYREKQIKFCYALLNLKTDLILIETILQRLSTYSNLESFEINFLIYLWLFEDDNFDFAAIVSEKFPLVVERLLSNYVTEILQLVDDDDVSQYFLFLESDKILIKVREINAKNTLLSKSVKTFIYRLYSHNSCNKNILNLLNFV